MNQDEQFDEVIKCYKNPAYFISNYVRIYDAIQGKWISFALWPAQTATLDTIFNNLLIVILKARQLGLTWLVLAFALWLMIFHPAATVLLFSRRDDESVHLLDDRLKGMYARLPDWLKVGQRILEDSAHEWQLSNGSVARAFPTTAGDSYTATLAIVDEADLVSDLNRLMGAVKPTIDGGGRMILLSRSDKTKPASTFKAIYRASKAGTNDWANAFLPWNARPERDRAWYLLQKRDILARTGSLDDLHEQYPETDAEALAPATKDKRIPTAWLNACYEEAGPIEVAEAPAIPGLEIYEAPVEGRKYVVGIDPAEGNPTSDDSALEVLDWITLEEVAALAGKIQPSTLGAYADEVGCFYNHAPLAVERNNHGHAVLLWLEEHSELKRLTGYDDKPGWLNNARGKALMYSECADAFREGAQEGTKLVHSMLTYLQLASIEGSTLQAPDGEHDDRATAYALGVVGCAFAGRHWFDIGFA